VRITSSHEGPPHTNSPYSHLPYPLSRSLAWNTTIDLHSSPHHPSISDTDPLYSALGATSTTLLPLSEFRLLWWHQRMVYRAHQPVLVSTSLQHDQVMHHPGTRALQFLFSVHGASGYALLAGALTLICRYHSLYSTPVWGSRSIGRTGPCAEKRSCRVGSARGRVGGSKLRYQNHCRSERADDVQKHLGSDRRL
jgi:hypothetical protein